MSNNLSVYFFLCLAGCLLLGILFSWLLYRNSGILKGRWLVLLALLRALGIATLAWLIFAPLFQHIAYTLEKPVIVIAQDNSLSLSHEPVGFDQEAYVKNMNLLKKALEADYEVRTYHFSDSVKPGFDFKNTGKLSNATQLISQLDEEYQNRNLGAVILATDGLFNTGGNPISTLNTLTAPVYTIALGDTVPRKDLLIANLNYNQLVYLDNDFPIEVEVQAYRAKGETAVLSVYHGNALVKQESVRIDQEEFDKTVSIKLHAAQPGLQQYTIRLSALKNEVTLKNNEQKILIDVLDDRQKVLIAAAVAHPDISALKQAIELNKHLEVKVALAEELNKLELRDYGLIILYQLPASDFNGASFLSRLKQVKPSLLYVIGAQTDFNAFNQSQSTVRLNLLGNAVQESYSKVNTDFSLFQLSDGAEKQINAFDPLMIPPLKVTVNADAKVLLTQRKDAGNEPQLFFLEDGERKTGFLIGEGLWRWRMDETKEGREPLAFNELMAQAMQYLSAKADKRKFRIYTDKTNFNENERIQLNALLYNDAYQPVNASDVNLQLKNEQGKVYNFIFSRQASVYQLDAGLLPPGNYTYQGTTTLGARKFTATGAFFVNPLTAEFQQTVADHQLLYTMSAQTNGKMVMPAQIMDLVKLIKTNEQVKTLSFEDRKYEELINFKWIFALILLMLTVEWLIRKRNGAL